MTETLQLHPIAAELSASIVRDGDGLTLPADAIEKARAQLRGADEEAVRHLVALAVKVSRVSGRAGLAVNIAIAMLVGEKLGSTKAAADRFASAGLEREAQAFLGSTATTKAPRADDQVKTSPAAATIKAKRGLSKPDREG